MSDDDLKVARWGVLLAGDVVPTARLQRQLAGARVVAADAGLRHAATLGLQPEALIGDFDSVADDLLAAYQHVRRIAYSPDKDMTDGALAIAHALEQGARELLLVGALGGERSDHAMMHLLQLADLAEKGIAARASSGLEEAYGLVAGGHVIDLPPGSSFSLLGFGALHDVHLQGARWPLHGEVLPFASSRPLSNVAEGPISLRIGGGYGVLLARPALAE